MTQRRFLSLWFVQEAKGDGPGVALAAYGLGERIANMKDVQKGDFEGKFWLKIEEISIEEAFCYNFTPAAKREIKKIIYQHFDLIVDAWYRHFINPENGKIE